MVSSLTLDSLLKNIGNDPEKVIGYFL